MKFKKIIPIVAVGALAIAVVLGVVGYRTVKAAAPAATAYAINAHGIRGGFSDQELADALGVSLETLQAAYKTADTAALKQAVEQGLLTQAQADQLAARENKLGFHRGFGGGTIDYNALLADALGVSVDKLQEAYTKAFTARIDSAVASGEITQAQADLALGRNALSNNSDFQAAMKSAFEAAVNAAVKSGVITQSQADQILSNQAGTGLGPKGFGGFDGFEGFGGRGRHGGPDGDWLPGTQNNNSAPSTTPSTGGDL